MTRRSKSFPVLVLGMDPPTKKVTVAKLRKPLDGYAVIIRWADFPEGMKSGDVIQDDAEISTHGIATWLQFTNADAMRCFGQLLIDSADGKQYKRRQPDVI